MVFTRGTEEGDGVDANRVRDDIEA